MAHRFASRSQFPNGPHAPLLTISNPTFPLQQPSWLDLLTTNSQYVVCLPANRDEFHDRLAQIEIEKDANVTDPQFPGRQIIRFENLPIPSLPIGMMFQIGMDGVDNLLLFAFHEVMKIVTCS